MSEPTPNILRTGTKRHKIALIDGPNMSNLGRRNKKVYGAISSLKSLQDYVVAQGAALGVDVEVFSSNHEGAILEFIHDAPDRVDGIIINPAGLTPYSLGVPHALAESELPVLEVHFSNTEAAAGTQRGPSIGPVHSVFTPLVSGKFMGMREYSYVGALVAMVLGLDDTEFFGGKDS